MQRHALLMYTSCGWFFDELSGMETVQIIQYAGRAVQLAEKTAASRPSKLLSGTTGSGRQQPAGTWVNGAEIYARCVKPAR
jgi:hypothetical protein